MAMSRNNELNPTTKTPTDDAAANCHLKRLSPELRNRIYDLVFATEETADLLTAKPPQGALLETCRQLYTEAHLVHKESCRKFWEETQFYVHCVEKTDAEPGYIDTTQQAIVFLETMTDQHFARIATPIRIRCRHWREGFFDLVFHRGVWKRERFEQDPPPAVFRWMACLAKCVFVNRGWVTNAGGMMSNHFEVTKCPCFETEAEARSQQAEEPLADVLDRAALLKAIRVAVPELLSGLSVDDGEE